jgi:tetratricopeptide (TPR) repeat protein
MRYIPMVFIGLLLLPLALYSFQPEIVQWRAAQAIQEYQNGDQKNAIADLKVITEDSNDVKLKLRLAGWLKKNEDTDQAIELVDRVVGKHLGATSMPSRSNLEKATYIKADCLIMQGKHEQAIELIETLINSYSESESQSIQNRNSISYYRALCDKDLNAATRDMNQVIADLGNDSWTKFPVSFSGNVAVAVGLVSRHTDQRLQGIETISNRLEKLDRLVQGSDFELKNQLYRFMHNFVPLNKQMDRSVERSRKLLDEYRNEVIVSKSVLALLLEETDSLPEAMRMRNEVTDAGFDCEEVLASLPSEFRSLATLESGATLLDTRGYVLFVHGNHESSLQDLDLAIAASEVRRKSMDTPLMNTTDMIVTDSMRTSSRRNLAVLLNHRMQVYDKLQETKKAKLDRDRIMELGFKPGPNLF